MEESSTYQLILRKGYEQGLRLGAQRMIRHQGTKLFGPPDETTQMALEAITDFERLQEIAVRLFTASSWQELLASPSP